MIGTTADSRSRSVCTRLDTARRRAISAGSRMVINPSGLSSRTTSPVSVTHAVVCSPLNVISTRNAGTFVSPALTAARLPTTASTGALVSVAGSNIIHLCRDPGTRPALASIREKFSVVAGGSASSMTWVRVSPPDVISTITRRASLDGDGRSTVP